MNIRRWRQFDFSLGVQEATTWLLKKPNELARGTNLKFTEVVGGFQRRNGFQRVGSQFSSGSKIPTGGHTARFSTGSVRFVACNNADDTATIIKTQNTDSGDWTQLPNASFPVNSVLFFKDHLDELYITGFNPLTGDPVQPLNVDRFLDVSTSRNILNMPACYFLEEFLGLLYAGNVSIGGTRFKDRVYKSSPPLGAMTFVQGAQVDVPAPVNLFDNVPSMTNYTTPFGVASASSEVNADNKAWQAFDDTVNNRWIAVDGSDEWVKYDFGVGREKAITYYSIVGERPGETPNRGPKSWVLQGSNDNTAWTDLHTVLDAPVWNAATAEKRIYSVNNTTVYRYYRLYIYSNQGGDYITIEELELMTSTEGVKAMQLKIDSARYIKPGMSVDIYKAGTETKLGTVDVLGVDKSTNTITYLPLTASFAPANVNVTDNTIDIPNSTEFATGTPVRFDTTGTVPGGLAINTTYYAIQTSTTNTTKTGSSLTAPDDGNGLWTNFNKAVVADGQTASGNISEGGSRTNRLVMKNFGFAIPAGTQILGIYVEVLANGTAAAMDGVSLFGPTQSNTKVGDDADALPSTPSWVGYGGATDLWNSNWTAADINSSDFGFSFSAYNTHGGGSVQVDSMRATVYYLGNGKIKVATSQNNALIGNAIDITSTGSGVMRVRKSYAFADNDEIWLKGRKGKLTMFWNTDYPTPETADYLALKPGTDSSNILTGIAKSSNRLFMFTRNSGTRWDGQNLVVFNNQVGCVSHRSIANIDDDWMIWVDQKGNIRARNESASQQENISRSIRNRYMRKLTLDQLKAVSAIAFDNTYKLFLGDVDGAQTRVVYDFDANTWSPEKLGYPALLPLLDDTTGYLKPYFYSNNGRLYIDETGNMDDDKVIPMEAGSGRDMFGTEQIKNFTGMLIYSRGAIGSVVMAAVDGGQMKTIGKITKDVCYFPFPSSGESKLEDGTSLDWQIVNSLEGDPPYIEGDVLYYTTREDTPSERR